MKHDRAKEISRVFFKYNNTASRKVMADSLNVSESSVLRTLRKAMDEYPSLIDKQDYKTWVDRTQQDGDLHEDLDPDVQIRINKLENQVQYWRGQYNNILEKYSEIDSYYDVMQKAVSPLKPVDIPRIKKENKKEEEIAVALLSDLHGGEIISPEETDYLGVFNTEILARRLELWAKGVKNVVNLHRKNYNIKKLVILDLGDKISGMIHEELEIHSDIEAGHQYAVISYLIAQTLMLLAQEFEEIKIHSIVGNHSRKQQKKKSKGKYVNYDYDSTQLVSLFCKNQDNIKFNAYKAPKKRITIGNKTGIIAHGDSVRSYSGVPWYGLIRKSRQLLGTQSVLRNMKERSKEYTNDIREELDDVPTDDIEFIMMGHFHQLFNIEKAWGSIFVNGCFPGPSEYSIDKNMISRPGQWIMGFHKNYISWRYALYLDQDENPHNPEILKTDMPNDWGDIPNLIE